MKNRTTSFTGFTVYIFGTSSYSTQILPNSALVIKWILVSEYQQYQEATIEEDEEFDHDEDADE